MFSAKILIVQRITQMEDLDLLLTWPFYLIPSILFDNGIFECLPYGVIYGVICQFVWFLDTNRVIQFPQIFYVWLELSAVKFLAKFCTLSRSSFEVLRHIEHRIFHYGL